MLDATDPSLEPANPFASPEKLEMDERRVPNVPSLRVLAIGLIVGLIAFLATAWMRYFDPGISWPDRASFLVPDVLHWVLYGLGIALLIHAVIHRCWGTLAPGHWRLIAFLAYLVCPWIVPSPWLQYAFLIANAGILLALSSISREPRVWKAYAWICAGTLLLSIVAVYLSVLFQQQFASVQQVGLEHIDFSPTSVAVWASISALTVMALNCLSVIWMVAGMLYDRRQAIRRDIYHTLGLILIVLFPTISIANRVIFLWLFPQT